jgi:RNA polymerase sigma factor (TIGR02999 family)
VPDGRRENAMPDANDVTVLLRQWHAGDPNAMDRLLPLVYDELRRIARRHMSGERPGHTLQTTAVVHEAFVRLVGADVTLADRAHFFALASRSMRQLLVDHARGRARDKRGAGAALVPLDENLLASQGASPVEMVDLDRALDALGALDARQLRVVELHFFGGLGLDEIAEQIGVSHSTVKRDLRVARAFLHREMTGD